jgi:hypothetical protein
MNAIQNPVKCSQVTIPTTAFLQVGTSMTLFISHLSLAQTAMVLNAALRDVQFAFTAYFPTLFAFLLPKSAIC